MKNPNYLLLAAAAFILFDAGSYGQKKPTGIELITASDLQNNMTFLASPLLRGRANGETGLEIAQEYIISQARLMGLKPANGTSYYQPYIVNNSTLDPEKTMIRVVNNITDTVTFRSPIYQVNPTGPAEYSVSGEVVFAGYGLRQDKYGYNDYLNLNTDGKILLIMAGAPTSEDGKKYLFGGVNWSSVEKSVEAKLTPLLFNRAKAVIIVMDPKSGFSSLDQRSPGIAGELASESSLLGQKAGSPQMAMLPKILFADRVIADELLKGSGYTLEGLQKKIDTELKPCSFTIPGKQVIITEFVREKEITLNNIAAYIEGSDPVLKNEYIVFSGHADHIGASGDRINAGADDNASGCAALLSIAKAFQSLEKKPLRSILFLWVSGEELGLFGSKTYVSNPLVPLEKTVADLNMDMVGRTKEVADSIKSKPVAEQNKVFVVTDYQSKELLSIVQEIDNATILDMDYSLSGRNHPLQLFIRSDHYNFARKDIPVLFFTDGEHSDYHTPGDVLGKIDFRNMELITRAMYQIGYNVASRRTRIVVDNPFSKW